MKYTQILQNPIKTFMVTLLACIVGMGALMMPAAPVFAGADAQSAKTVSVADKTQAATKSFVQTAESYLQNLDTAYARFVQTTANGQQVSGTFYMNRPGKLRFEYDSFDDFIVADGRFIYFYDAELGEQTNAPIGQTLADFLLRPNLRLNGDITVTDVRSAGDLTLVTLVQADDPHAGSLTLGFEKDPVRLRKWRVVDATGAITEIELFDLETGVTLDKELFVYRDPAPRRPYDFNE